MVQCAYLFVLTAIFPIQHLVEMRVVVIKDPVFFASFLFDETTIQTLSQSNESLNQALEGDPIKVDDEEVEDRSSTSMPLGIKIRSKKKAGHRRSAPPISQIRDSVGSLVSMLLKTWCYSKFMFLLVGLSFWEPSGSGFGWWRHSVRGG